jgi:uncharacterized membrane protein YdjX (TVP38/TMEM64 family)
VRFGLLVALVAGLGTAMLVVGPDQHGLTALITGAPVLAPLAAVLASAALVPALAPRTLLAAVGGALFGALAGTVYVLLGVTLGATVAFLVGRVLGRDFVVGVLHRRPALRGRLGLLERVVQRWGLLSVVVLRLIPLIPFGLANYACGTTGLRRRDFAVGTLLGAAPATVAYALLGAAATHHDTATMALASGVALALGVAGTIGTALVWRHRHRLAPETATGPAAEAEPAAPARGRLSPAYAAEVPPRPGRTGG